MNNILSRILCNLSIVSALSISFSAKAGVKDTTLLLANNTGNVSPNALTTAITKEANIIYPASLKENMDESLDYIQKFSKKKRDYLIRTYQKGKKFFPKVAAVLKRYQLPQELKVLIALESAFNPNAVSGAGAVGYWQFMNASAIEYGLRIVDEKDAADPKNKRMDERKNFAKSTIAAAKYLRDRCKNLNNDLLLMVASYNCGIGNVWQAKKKCGKNNPDFWDIKKFLPAETQSYVMNFIALNVVFENYDKFLKNKLIFNSETIEIPIPENAIKLNTPSTD
ncbi:MAG: lytic transglycosylase domain-containing protein [Chitinophagaceae bacterium]